MGDSAEALRALIPLLVRKQDRSWRKKLEVGIAQWWKVLEARAMEEADPINPQRVFWSCLRACPTIAFLPAIPVQQPIGLPATSKSEAA